MASRPRRRRFEALTADAKIIRLIRRRVAFFSDGGGATVFRRDYGWICREQTFPQFKLERLQVEHSTAGIGRAYA